MKKYKPIDRIRTIICMRTVITEHRQDTDIHMDRRTNGRMEATKCITSSPCFAKVMLLIKIRADALAIKLLGTESTLVKTLGYSPGYFYS